MSLGLVAYGSSDDESENSDIDEQKELVSQKSQTQNLKVPQHDPTSNAVSKSGASDNVTSGSTYGQESGAYSINGSTKNSGSSDISDEEEIVPSTSTGSLEPNNNVSLSGHISDEEDTSPGPVKFSILAGLPAPKNAPTESIDLSFFTAAERPKKVQEAPPSQLLSGLPAPKTSASVSLSGYDGEDEVEEEYKKKPVKAEVPVPKKRQPVKISIPSLLELESDEEEDEPKKKKPKPSGGGLSGLLSVLPSPKQMIVKEKGRALIPHTLTKRPAAKTSAASLTPRSIKATSTSSQKQKLPGIPENADSDSDDEDDSVNFFSFGGDEPSSSNVTKAEASNAVPQIDPLLTPSPSSLYGAKYVSKSVPSSAVTFTTQKKTLNAPVLGSKNVTVSSNLNVLRGPYNSGSSAAANFQPSYVESHPNEGYKDNAETAGYSGHVEEASYSEYYQPSVAQMEKMTQDEQFQRMVGKKYRGEAMHIVDVNADDQINQVDLTKNLTEEVSGFSYSKKKNKDMPSSMSKRKHQITYLAFQAKEKEVELKNQWAQNKQTKRHTQSKYGF